MKLTEIVKRLMTETIGEETRLNEKEVDIREFDNLFPWFDNYGIIVLLNSPRWVASPGFWAEAYIAFEEEDEIVYGAKGILLTEEEKNIIVIGGKVKKYNRDMILEFGGTDQRIVILSYLYEKTREKPKEEADLFLRYTKAVPSIGVIGMLRFESVYSKMPRAEQKRFLKTLRTESKSIPLLRETINLLDRSDIDISYA